MSEPTRDRVLAATAALLRDGGSDAVSTRAVSAAAAIQAPTLYRLFGDKQGLLDAVATAGYAEYLAGKADRVPSGDPVADLRAGWDLHVGFGLANPDVFRLMYGAERRGEPAPVVVAGRAILAEHVHRIAVAGRLRVPEGRAAELVHAAGTGTTLTLLATPEPERDPELSALARDAVLAAITTEPADAPAGPVAAAVALGAALPELDVLSGPERALLGEWLARISR